MKSVDTNIVLRLLLNDDPTQRATAREIFSGPVLLLPTVVLESEWVMRAVAKRSRAEIADGLETLLDLATLLMPDAPALRWALAKYRDGGDFGDLFHLALSGLATSFATFDRDIARHADASVVSVETLA